MYYRYRVSEELVELLSLKFRKGIYGVGYYIKNTKHCVLVRQRDGLIFLQGTKKHKKEIQKKIVNQAIKKDINWIVVDKDAKDELVSVLPTSTPTIWMCEFFRSAANLNSDLEFKEKVYYDSSIELDYTSPPKIKILSNQTLLKEINNPNDIIEFNGMQQTVIDEARRFRENILKKIKIFDDAAVLSHDMKTVTIFNQPYVFLTQVKNDKWIVSFFKYRTSESIFEVDSLSEIEEQCITNAAMYCEIEKNLREHNIEIEPVL